MEDEIVEFEMNIGISPYSMDISARAFRNRADEVGFDGRGVPTEEQSSHIKVNAIADLAVALGIAVADAGMNRESFAHMMAEIYDSKDELLRDAVRLANLANAELNSRPS